MFQEAEAASTLPHLDELKYILPIFVMVISSHFGISGLCKDLEEKQHPRILAVLFSAAVMVIGVVFLILGFGGKSFLAELIWGVLAVGLVSLAVTLYALTRVGQEKKELIKQINDLQAAKNDLATVKNILEADKNTLEINHENLELDFHQMVNTLRLLKQADRQVNSIFGEIYRLDDQRSTMKPSILAVYVADVYRAIENALVYIQALIEQSLPQNADNMTQFRSTILAPDNGRFRVVAAHRVEGEHRTYIEKNMSYAPKARGIAGRAASECRTICINDLKDSSNPDVEYWVKIGEEQAKTGSVFCRPITESSLQTNSPDGLMGVLSMSCAKENGFPYKPTEDVVSYYLQKIKILLHLREITKRMFGL